MAARLQYATLWALYVAQRAMAIPWAGPEPTAAGLMNMPIGFSPMPTGGPRIVPKDLLKRQFPIPDDLCGYVSGDINSPLSCAIATQTCVYYRTAVGCCDAGAISTCTNLFTECRDYGASCGAACSADPDILQCNDPEQPRCNAYTFSSDLVNYNCALTRDIQSVDFISDVYLTAFPTRTLTDADGPNTFSDIADEITYTVTGNTAIPTGTGRSVPTAPSDEASNVAVGVGAIVGIVIGALLLIGGIIAAVVVCCLMRRRKRRRAARQSAGFLPTGAPTMGQAPPAPLPQGHQYAPGAQQTSPVAYATNGEATTYFEPNPKPVGGMHTSQTTPPAPPYAASPPTTTTTTSKTLVPDVSMLDSRPTSYAVSPTSETGPASAARYPSPPPPVPSTLYPAGAGQGTEGRFERGGTAVEQDPHHAQASPGPGVYEMGSERGVVR